MIGMVRNENYGLVLHILGTQLPFAKQLFPRIWCKICRDWDFLFCHGLQAEMLLGFEDCKVGHLDINFLLNMAAIFGHEVLPWCQYLLENPAGIEQSTWCVCYKVGDIASGLPHQWATMLHSTLMCCISQGQCDLDVNKMQEYSGKEATTLSHK